MLFESRCFKVQLKISLCKSFRRMKLSFYKMKGMTAFSAHHDFLVLRFGCFYVNISKHWIKVNVAKFYHHAV